jgi:serralysin
MQKTYNFFKLYIALLSAAVMVTGCGQQGRDAAKGAKKSADSTITRKGFVVCSAKIPPFKYDSTKFQIQAVVWNTGRWNKRNLIVKFTGGDPIVITRVEQTARQWEHIANLKFTFTTDANAPADITVGFSETDGTWSEIGKYSESKAISMNYSALHANDSDYWYRYYVLHEFGHALGLMHEHQSPNAHIVWNLPALYNYCSDKFGWNAAMVKTNILDFFSDNVTATRYDPASIMLYDFPDSLVISGNVPTVGNSHISKLDSITIDSLYNKTYPPPL